MRCFHTQPGQCSSSGRFLLGYLALPSCEALTCGVIWLFLKAAPRVFHPQSRSWELHRQVQLTFIKRDTAPGESIRCFHTVWSVWWPYTANNWSYSRCFEIQSSCCEQTHRQTSSRVAHPGLKLARPQIAEGEDDDEELLQSQVGQEQDGHLRGKHSLWILQK